MNICQNCGEALPAIRSPQRKFCSGKCRKAASRRNIAAEHLEAIIESTQEHLQEIEDLQFEETETIPITVKRRGEKIQVSISDVEYSPAAVKSLIEKQGYDPERWTITALSTSTQSKILAGRIIEVSKNIATLEYVPAPEETPFGQLITVLKETSKQPRSFETSVAIEDISSNKIIVLAGDDQAPHNNEPLHQAFCAMLADIKPDGYIDMGDGVDLDSIATHAPNLTNFVSTVQEGFDSKHRLLTERLAAAGPQLVFKKYLIGNHEWRLDKAIVKNLPQILGLKKANMDPNAAPVLSTRNLLRLDDLGFEIAASKRGDYPHGHVKLANELLVYHGWIARKGAGSSAQGSIERLNSGIVTGHTHRLAVAYATRWDQTGEPHVYTTAETGTLASPEGLQYASYPDWQNGLIIATISADGTSHHLEPVPYRNGFLTWRGQRWS